MHLAQLAEAFDAGEMILSYLATMSCTGRLSFPTFVQKQTFLQQFVVYQGKITGRAECLTHYNFRLTFAVG
jgi:hypothetical protein